MERIEKLYISKGATEKMLLKKVNELVDRLNNLIGKFNNHVARVE